MIQIVPCSQCNKELLLPHNVSLQAILSCPECGERIVLGEFLKSKFAYWNVVDDPLANQATAELGYAKSDPTGKSPVSTDALQQDEPDPASDPGELQQEVGESEIKLAKAEGVRNSRAKAELDVQPITHEQFERIKRKQRSPLWGIIQVVLGGAAAVPIALLILWHVLGKDIGGAGPAVAAYVPWIVPEQFRPLPDEPQAPSSSRRRGESGFRNFDDVMPMTGSTTGDNSSGQGPDGNSGVVAFERDRTASERPFLDSGADRGQKAMSEMDSANEASEGMSALPGREPAGVAGGQNPASPDTRNILLLVERCRQDLIAWKSMMGDEEVVEPGDQREVAQKLYRDLTDLSAVVSDLPEGTPIVRAIRNSLQPIGKLIKSVPSVQGVIEQGAKHWQSTYSEQPILPLAVIIEIGQVSEEEQGWVLRPAQADLAGGISKVVVPSVLAPSLIPGQKLFLLGRLYSSLESSDLNSPTGELVDGNESVADLEQAGDPATRQRWFEASYLHGL